MILDCSYRLPGPFASKLLQKDGNKVVKIELCEKRDPFFLSDHPGVKAWYKRFNEGKSLEVLSEEDFKKFLEKNQKVITGIIIDIKSPFLKNVLNYPFLTLVISASINKDNRPMHDLDILAKSGYFSSFDTPIPEIPAAGILFANQIYSTFYKAKSEHIKKRVDIYLEQVTSTLELITLPEKDRFYRGVMIGYNKYKLEDGVLYLTAIESKNFEIFISFIGLEKYSKIQPTENELSPVGDLIRNNLSKMCVKDFSNYPKKKKCFSIIETHRTE